jgi:hypothetical protein
MVKKSDGCYNPKTVGSVTAQRNRQSFGKYEFMLDDDEEEIEEPKPRLKASD